MDSKETKKTNKGAKDSNNNFELNSKNIYPFIPTRDVIVLEGITDFIEIGRLKSKNSINLSTKSFGSFIVLIPQKDAEKKDVKSTTDIQKYGVLAKIIKVQEIGVNQRVTVQGIKKVELVDFDSNNEEAYIGHFEDAKPVTKFKLNDKNVDKLKQLHKTLYNDFVGTNDQFKKMFVKSAIPFFSEDDIVKLENMNQVISCFTIPIKFIYIYFNQKTMLGKLDVL